MEIQTQIETITPQMADSYLKTNTGRQRPLDHGRVSYYARMMRNAQWQLNGEAIVFDNTGALVNGQHRCAACVMACVPFSSLVVRNVHPSAFTTFDTGRNRSRAQVFGIADIPNASSVSSSIGQYLRMTVMPNATSLEAVRCTGRGDKRFCNDDLLRAYYADPDYWQSVHRFAKAMHRHCALLTVAEVSSIFAFLNKTKGYGWDFVSNFFEQLFFEEKTQLDVMRKMRKKLIDDRMGVMKMVPLYRTQLLVKTWNYYKTGRSPKTLSWSKGAEPARFFN